MWETRSVFLLPTLWRLGFRAVGCQCKIGNQRVVLDPKRVFALPMTSPLAPGWLPRGGIDTSSAVVCTTSRARTKWLANSFLLSDPRQSGMSQTCCSLADRRGGHIRTSYSPCTPNIARRSQNGGPFSMSSVLETPKPGFARDSPDHQSGHESIREAPQS